MFSAALSIQGCSRTVLQGRTVTAGPFLSIKLDLSSHSLPSMKTALPQISYERAWPDGQEKEM